MEKIKSYLYQHAKSQAISSRDIVDLKILQSDFGPHTRNQNFPRYAICTRL